MVALVELAAFNFRASTLNVSLIFIRAEIGDDFDPSRRQLGKLALGRRML